MLVTNSIYRETKFGQQNNEFAQYMKTMRAMSLAVYELVKQKSSELQNEVEKQKAELKKLKSQEAHETVVLQRKN